MSIAGVSFDDAWANRVTSDVGGVTAVFISKEDLIKSKKATGRPQDLIDAGLLELTSKTK